jgi:hypothetical protein
MSQGQALLSAACVGEYEPLREALGSLRVEHLKEFSLEELYAVVERKRGGPYHIQQEAHHV